MRQLIVLTTLMAFAIPAYASPVHQVAPVGPHLVATNFVPPFCAYDPQGGIFAWICKVRSGG